MGKDEGDIPSLEKIGELLKHSTAVVSDVCNTLTRLLKELSISPLSEKNLPKVGCIDVLAQLTSYGPSCLGAKGEEFRDKFQGQVEIIIKQYEQLYGYERITIPLRQSEAVYLGNQGMPKEN